MALRVLAMQDTRFLIGTGPGVFDGFELELGRIYDRPFLRLSDPLPVDSITARGYWEPLDATAEAQVPVLLAEVDEILSR